jgi:hypothetical protein
MMVRSILCNLVGGARHVVIFGELIFMIFAWLAKRNSSYKAQRRYRSGHSPVRRCRVSVQRAGQAAQLRGD